MRIAGRLLLDPAATPQPGWIETEGPLIRAIGTGEAGPEPDVGGRGALVCPGFIDAHVHLPQIHSIGCDGMDLLDWLEAVIYPSEMRWADRAHAQREAAAAYTRMLDAGTLGYAGYLSSHEHALTAAIRCGHRCPLRACVGQVLMDRAGPEALLHQPLARLARSERGRLDASVNPRFAIACSEELLCEAGRRAAGGAFIQTHLSESRRECARARELFPHEPSYAAIYDRFGLLTPRTLLAHCVHLTEEEWTLIAERGAVVVHCPGANVFLRSGLFPLSAARAHGVRLALGSDVAAGPDASMPRVARAMIEVAKTRAMTIEPGAPVPTPAEAWRMITAGNAEALGFTGGGRLEAGAPADLLVLRVPFDIDEHLIGRLLYTWRDDYIEHRIVAGRRVAF